MNYLISDTHFNHTNVIRYCNRPFPDVDAMNRTLVNRWNATVSENDTVYFLGDFAFSNSVYWLKQLKGKKMMVRGSHDNGAFHSCQDLILHSGKFNFLCVHNPADIPREWRGWTIHGHTHNNNMENYPFINGAYKTINVSVELIGYRPLSLDRLLDLDISTIKRMDTLDSIPERYGDWCPANATPQAPKLKSEVFWAE